MSIFFLPEDGLTIWSHMDRFIDFYVNKIKMEHVFKAKWRNTFSFSA